MRGKSVSTQTWRIATLALMLWGLGALSVVQADNIVVPASASIGPSPSFPGTGLDGAYYYANLTMSVNNETTVDDFRASIAAATPGRQGSFIGRSLNWTGGDTTPVNMFLGTDGASLTPAITHQLNTSYFDMTGYINVPRAGTFTFHTNSDDASFVLVAGMQVVNNGTTHGCAQDASGTAMFSQPGLYPIEILYSNQDFTNNGMVSQGGANLSYDSNVGGDLATGTRTALYAAAAVPEPGSVALIGLGLVGLLGYVVRRRRSS